MAAPKFAFHGRTADCPPRSSTSDRAATWAHEGVCVGVRARARVRAYVRVDGCVSVHARVYVVCLRACGSSHRARSRAPRVSDVHGKLRARAANKTTDASAD